ncbi:uncharacterized protein BDW43DRAFT_267482 [Aspergillus alliaceus]|uniref:uncharacterized protein n=1 Tax=Petromyces alliaceus TaxID=209559 RepID=UPI0012A5BDAC|nr:uncharacterized protein BDW43DRAFT_267482 [Aspergillus alliaceus]KAB8236696.1 hypothetical protein BDW43DRAFT_267482 [Aspergillus alliaceus]
MEAGCYNFSQRRIYSNRGTPICEKCIKKGLEYLDLGNRYRFSNGIASSRKARWKIDRDSA